MKTQNLLTVILLALTLLVSCNKPKSNVLADVTTVPVSDVLYTTAVCGGIVGDYGGDGVTARGVCWNTNPSPTAKDLKTIDGGGAGQYASSLTQLKAGTLYHVRAYAITATDTVYGDELTFTTKLWSVSFNTSLTYGTLTDIDGTNYKTIQIGFQTWMAENLKTTRLNDGTALPLIKTNASWADVIEPAYCWFQDNDTLYGNIYGAYYSWFAASTGKLCPTGWHVPNDTEWKQLVDYLGGESVAGSKLKEAGTNNWAYSNSDATNQSGFTGLPAGMRQAIDGSFAGQGYYGGWWTSNETESSQFAAAWTRTVHGDTTVVGHSSIYKKDGFSVRCVKD